MATMRLRRARSIKKMARNAEQERPGLRRQLTLGCFQDAHVDVVANILHVRGVGQLAREKADQHGFVREDLALKPGFRGVGHHVTLNGAKPKKHRLEDLPVPLVTRESPAGQIAPAA